jgi:glucokinase
VGSPTIGMDVGGTRLRAARVRDGVIEARLAVDLYGDSDPLAVAERVTEAARSLGDAPVGIGIAAMLRGDTGVVANSPNLGWRDVPFGKLVEQRLGRPVRIENDLSAITWGEYRFGAGRGARSIACVFLGTGVGGGAVLDGRLYRGANNNALEIGHIKVAPPDRTCGCGRRGCLESYVGGVHLGRHPDSAAIETAATLLGRALADLCTLLNPDRLVLGGSVWHGEAHLRTRTLDVLHEAVNPPAREALLVVNDELGDNAGVLGAADLVNLTP